MEHFEAPVNLVVMNKTVPIACPKCGSRHCQLQATARKIGAVVGAVLAVIASIVSRRSSATTIETIGGAIGALAWGAIAGHVVGADLDEDLLQFHKCLSCGFEF